MIGNGDSEKIRESNEFNVNEIFFFYRILGTTAKN